MHLRYLTETCLFVEPVSSVDLPLNATQVTLGGLRPETTYNVSLALKVNGVIVTMVSKTVTTRKERCVLPCLLIVGCLNSSILIWEDLIVSWAIWSDLRLWSLFLFNIGLEWYIIRSRILGDLTWSLLILFKFFLSYLIFAYLITAAYTIKITFTVKFTVNRKSLALLQSHLQMQSHLLFICS